jgi:hypothetical protein
MGSSENSYLLGTWVNKDKKGRPGTYPGLLDGNQDATHAWGCVIEREGHPLLVVAPDTSWDFMGLRESRLEELFWEAMVNYALMELPTHV